MKPPATVPGALLTQGFTDFIAASARLEFAYGELQAKVAALNLRLHEQGQALRSSESEKDNTTALLRQLVEAMPCGVLLLNADETVRLANPEAARLLALLSSQMPLSKTSASAPAEEPFAAQQSSEIPQQTHGAPEQTQGSPLQSDFARLPRGAEHELHLRSSAGSHWIRCRRVQIDAPEGAAAFEVGPAVILEDITARKLNEQRREAERSSAALAEVAALLAHEIRNPLASLELFAGLLADSPDRQGEWLSHLRAGIRSLSGTVNNVLTLHGETLPALEPVELGCEVRNAVHFLQPLASQAGVQLAPSPTEGELWVHANRSAVHQLVLNLVTNALRHAQGGEVRVSTQRHSPGLACVVVADTGCGIRPEDLPRLFESGFSASGTRPGLGLAVCRRLMRHQHGAIHVQSQPGQGSTFTLEFQTV